MVIGRSRVHDAASATVLDGDFRSCSSLKRVKITRPAVVCKTLVTMTSICLLTAFRIINHRHSPVVQIGYACPILAFLHDMHVHHLAGNTTGFTALAN